jgi:hypothetical protein
LHPKHTGKDYQVKQGKKRSQPFPPLVWIPFPAAEIHLRKTCYSGQKDSRSDIKKIAGRIFPPAKHPVMRTAAPAGIIRSCNQAKENFIDGGTSIRRSRLRIAALMMVNKKVTIIPATPIVFPSISLCLYYLERTFS